MEHDKIIKDAQYRKGLSIAYFNATNNAIELAKLIGGSKDLESIKQEVTFWRNWLLEGHQEYYANVIAKIGTNYNAEEAIKKLKATKTLAELKTAWQLFSEDERHDEEIVRIKDELKKAYEKAR